MSDDDSVSEERDVYTPSPGVKMDRDGEFVYPDFRAEENPGTAAPPAERIGFPLQPVPTGGDVAYAFDGEPDRFPEMDFRSLANDLPDGERIPNTTYLTHAIHKHPAIFIPHIPSYVIRRFTGETNADGERPLVLDPFSGSGTTGVEAKVNGRDHLGIEINPLSRLVSEVATTPIPPTLLERVRQAVVEAVGETDERVYGAFDVEFPDRTAKEHWFEPRAIRDLTRIRKVVSGFRDSDVGFDAMTDRERAVLDDLGLGRDDLRNRVYRWLVLAVANTVFAVSNADPGVSKAYRSKRMRRKTAAGEHPPDVLATHGVALRETSEKLTDLWNRIYDAEATGTDDDEGTDAPTVAGNRAHRAEVDIRLGDARTFDIPEYRGRVDLAVTSPPYINAMNYYRGTKLRLFWIQDLLSEDEAFDTADLRRSIIGSNSISLREVERDLPASVRSIWNGSEEEFERTRLPHLDAVIEDIHDSDHNSSERAAYVTWKFFAEDMLQSLTRVYEHLKPGGYFFFLIGENTIGKRLVHSHKFVEDIAANLGRFEGHGGNLSSDEGYRVIGSAWDEITNRDLFQNRNHEGGVIECEWMVMLQRPPG